MKVQSFVISLKNAKLRRSRLKAIFGERRITFEYVDAFDASTYSPEQIDNKIWLPRRGWKNYLRPGAVCCALSHLRVYSLITQRNLAGAAVFEDDAEPRVDRNDLGRLYKEFLSSDIDMLLLCSYSPFHRVRLHEPKDSVLSGHQVLEMGKPATGGAIAYFIRRSAAERIAEFNEPVRCTADAYGEMRTELGLRISVIKPDVVVPSSAESSIDYLSRRKRFLRKFFPSKILFWRRRQKMDAARSNYDIVP